MPGAAREAQPDPAAEFRPWWWLRPASLVLFCIAVYWVNLGSTGFSMSEGHRVAPAWEMLESRDFRVTRMFGEVYFRKPPGMMWAIAAFSDLIAAPEFGARAVSALACTLMTLVAWRFTTRRWGPVAGFLAGVLQAGMPMLWEAGRSAEIEALHTLGVQLACLGLLDLLLPVPGSPWRLRPGAVAACAGGVLVAMLTKGPAGLPAVGAVLAAGAFVLHRSQGDAENPGRLLPGLVVAAASLAASVGVLWWIAQGVAAAGPAVTQSPGEFLWDTSKLGSILLLPLTGLAAALPGSLVLLFLPAVWRSRSPHQRAALALILAGALATLAYAASGISNPRYTMPAAILWPPALAGVLAPSLARLKGARTAESFSRSLFVVLLLAGIVVAGLSDRARAGDGGRGSGRPAGLAIGQALAKAPGISPMELWADGAVEARPEVLLYARLAAGQAGVDLRPRWSSILLRPFAPPPHACVLVRVESGVREGGEAVSAGRAVLWTGRAGKFDLVVLGPAFAGP